MKTIDIQRFHRVFVFPTLIYIFSVVHARDHQRTGSPGDIVVEYHTPSFQTTCTYDIRRSTLVINNRVQRFWWPGKSEDRMNRWASPGKPGSLLPLWPRSASPSFFFPCLSSLHQRLPMLLLASFPAPPLPLPIARIGIDLVRRAIPPWHRRIGARDTIARCCSAAPSTQPKHLH